VWNGCVCGWLYASRNTTSILCRVLVCISISVVKTRDNVQSTLSCKADILKPHVNVPCQDDAFCKTRSCRDLRD